MKFLILILVLVIPGWTQTVAPTNDWYSVFTAVNTIPANQDWNQLIYSPHSNRVYVWADAPQRTTWENAFASYINPTNCGGGSNQPCQGEPTNPWVSVSQCGTKTAGYIPYSANATLGGISACDGTTVTSGSSTIALNLIGNTKVQNTSGGWLVEDEVIEYSNIVSGNSTACIVYGGLTRGSRNTSAASHTATAAPGSASTYVAPECPTAAEDPAAVGMQTNVGSGLATTTEVPMERHPARDTVYDSKMKRIWALGGYYENRSFTDLSYWCIPNAGATTADCTSGAIAAGWTRVATTNKYVGRQEAMAVYDSDHDAIYRYGGTTGGPTSTMYVLCPHVDGNSPAACASPLNWFLVTPTCSGSCPTRKAGQLRYDPDHKVILEFGGGDPTNGNTNVLIYAPKADNTLSLTANSWTVGSSPPGITSSNCCRQPAFDYDTLRHLGVFYFGPGSLFTYNPVTDAWAAVTLVGGPSPTASTSNHLVYNSVTDTHVYMNNTGSALYTWELPGAAISSPVVTVYPRTTRGKTTRR